MIEQIGRYKILRALGSGGMGIVFLAHDPRLDRHVALKVPHFTAEDGPDVLERFHREARAVAKLSHPNICQVHDVGEEDGKHYLTMAYIVGKPLSSLLKVGEPISSRKVAWLIRKLTLALAHAHENGVIHRDLKPANIMIDKRSEPIIMDFGLARLSKAGEERLTATGAVMGTPAYMAPEQVRGDMNAMGPATDMYSVGVIMYELLTGQLPFQGTLGTILSGILNDRPKRPAEINEKVDAQLEKICLTAMAKSPADRHKSMKAVARQLELYLRADSENVLENPRLRSDSGAASSETRKPWLLSLVIAGVLAVAATFVFTLLAMNSGASDQQTSSTNVDSEWLSLFDGKTLDGWIVQGSEDWSVADGEIVVRGNNSKLVHLSVAPTDFDLRLECLLERDANSGIFIHSGVNVDQQDGYEIQLADFAQYGTGSIWDRAAFEEQIVKPSTWFPLEIRVRGNRITVTVNGRITVDYTDPEWTFSRGHVALQGHQGGRAKFRKIELRQI